MAQTAPKVIKVVKLKRFMPEIPETPKLKKLKHGPGYNSESSNTNVTNTYHDNEHTEIEHISQSPEEKTCDLQNNSDSSQIQVANGSKIKFRKCSHTLEELSKLHEHTDETLVKVGDVFDSRDTFKEYLNDNAKKWFYYYVCRNSKKKIIEYNCSCMAYNIKQREVVIRRQKQRTTACPCKIRLTIDQTTRKLAVYYVCNHHDHPTTASAFYHYLHAKHLPQHVKEEFLDLTYLGLDVELIQKYIHSAAGVTIKKKDLWSYAYRFRRKIFTRSISDERKKYIEDLITKIREAYGESCDTTDIDKPSGHSELVETVNVDETKRKTSASRANEKNDTVTIGTSTEDISNGSEDSLLKELSHSTDNTEVIVQYINGDGILCDKNGIPVTNSSAIIQFINNYTYVTPDRDLEEGFEETVFSELDSDSDGLQYPIDWESLHNKSAMSNSVISESETCVVVSEGPVSNDSAESTVECSENEAVNESHERLSPTPASAALYADMDNFRKYYYVDHRYVTLGTDSGEQNAQYKAVGRGRSNSSDDPNREEYIKAPPFVNHTIRFCSGHEHLALLTDADAVWPGAKFLTHDVFLKYINARAGRWFFYYSLVESGRTPENYVYKCVYGKTRVSKNAYRAKGLRKRNKLTTQCPCQIRLRRLEADPAYLTVLYSCNHHDHTLDERQFVAQPHSRRLPSHIKEEVKDLITHRVSFDVLRKYVAAVTGVRVYGKYFHNVRAGMRARGERRRYTKQQLADVTAKIRDLEATYGNAAIDNPEANIHQNQTKTRMLPVQVETEDCYTQVGLEDIRTQTQEYCELSDQDDFAEEVCIIMQADTLPADAQQSRLQTRLPILSHKDILMRVKKLKDSLRSDGLTAERSTGSQYICEPLQLYNSGTP